MARHHRLVNDRATTFLHDDLGSFQTDIANDIRNKLLAGRLLLLHWMRMTWIMGCNQLGVCRLLDRGSKKSPLFASGALRPMTGTGIPGS
jgi:hypothetical protein